jgi:peptide/nickel transport system ATP-binding protein/oligopeptide transport system ATP-binding protein
VTAPLLEVQDLRVHYPVRRGLLRARDVVRAVDGVSFAIGRGETFALVGESGSGKSSTGYAVLGLVRPTSGSIRFEGAELAPGDPAQRARIAQRTQIVWQDPTSALNPRMRIAASIVEPLEIQGLPRAARDAHVRELLALVGLSAEHGGRFPSQLSGGQRQRAVIARAIALEPALIVCDEAVSALDVSIRSQILNLLMALQRRLGVAYLFISHDLAVVRHVADRVAVMQAGVIREEAPTDALFAAPAHPYTRALLAAIPPPDPRRRTAAG